MQNATDVTYDNTTTSATPKGGAKAGAANNGPSKLVGSGSSGSVAGGDPRIGGLSREEAFRIKAFAESIGAADCMPAWMAREIAEKTYSTADEKPQNVPDQPRP